MGRKSKEEQPLVMCQHTVEEYKQEDTVRVRVEGHGVPHYVIVHKDYANLYTDDSSKIKTAADFKFKTKR